MRIKQKGIATIIVVGVIVVLGFGVAIVSDRFLGPDNPVEEAAEEMVENTVEVALQLPGNSVDIDFSKPDNS